jgi:hypothetical protein
LLEPSLSDLAAPQSVEQLEIHRRGLIFQAPSVTFQGHRIWGATSMILAELLARIPFIA